MRQNTPRHFVRRVTSEPAPAGFSAAKSLALALLLLAAPWIAGCGGEQDRGSAPTYTTDIYTVDLLREEGTLTTGVPTAVTRRIGYDNQPAFLSDGRDLIYASKRDDQVDIYRYDSSQGASTPLTRTPEREYQPLPLSGGDGFSAVRVEGDGSQRLWRFDLEGGNETPLAPDLDKVRYYVWADPGTIAVVDVGERPRLLLLDLDSGKTTTVLDNVGRSLQPVPGKRAISFLHEVAPAEWWVKEVHVDTSEVRPLVLARPGSQDHAWTPWGTLLMAQDSRLFQWIPGADADWEDWEIFADFSLVGIRKISRIAVSPAGDRLALVVEEPEAP
jgi:hypothetical protein